MPALPHDPITRSLMDMAAIHASTRAVVRAAIDLADHPLDPSRASLLEAVLGSDLMARGRSARARLLEQTAGGRTPGERPAVAPAGLLAGLPGPCAGTISPRRPDCLGGARICRQDPGPTAGEGDG